MTTPNQPQRVDEKVDRSETHRMEQSSDIGSAAREMRKQAWEAKNLKETGLSRNTKALWERLIKAEKAKGR